MENKELINSQDSQIQELLGKFLRVYSSSKDSESFRELHLDEDSLAAFVEGNLNRRESQPIVTHLVDCSFCRHITAELVKLDYAFAGIEELRTVNVEAENEPSRISEVLSGLLSRVFGSSEEAVFAHQETEKESEELEESENPKEDK